MKSRSLALSTSALLLLCVASASAEPDAANSARRALSAQAWADLCDRLKPLGEIVESEGVPDEELARVEGYRYLLAALAESIDTALYRSDLSDPQLRFNVTKYRSPAMPSSDARYLSAEVSGEGTYHLSGTLGNSPHVTVQAYGGVGALENFDIRSIADANGDFAVTIGGSAQDGAWMSISPQATMLYFREYFSDWDNARPSKFVLERLDRPTRGTPLTESNLTHLLSATAAKLERQVPYWKERMDRIRTAHDNSLSPPGAIGDVGLGDIQYGTGWFDLDQDEALLIELSPPDAVHWSFQLGNYWGEALDFANFTSSLNGQQVRRDSDGIARLVVARADPGVPNWLDTAGHQEGMIFYRYHLTKTKPIPTTRVVKISELRTLLPPDTPRFSSEERRAQIERRRASVVRRWAP